MSKGKHENLKYTGTADANEVDGEINDDEEDPTPQSYKDALDDLPAVLHQIISELFRYMGWMFSIFAGGLVPDDGGKIATICHYFGSSTLSYNFSQTHLNFKEHYLQPFTDFVKAAIYKCDVRQHHAHGFEASADSLNMSSANAASPATEVEHLAAPVDLGTLTQLDPKDRTQSYDSVKMGSKNSSSSLPQIAVPSSTQEGALPVQSSSAAQLSISTFAVRTTGDKRLVDISREIFPLPRRDTETVVPYLAPPLISDRQNGSMAGTPITDSLTLPHAINAGLENSNTPDMGAVLTVQSVMAGSLSAASTLPTSEGGTSAGASEQGSSVLESSEDVSIPSNMAPQEASVSEGAASELEPRSPTLQPRGRQLHAHKAPAPSVLSEKEARPQCMLKVLQSTRWAVMDRPAMANARERERNHSVI
ncbi:hypothetical protein OBBRIDRAFT_808081 [Obba rivulosa]|uniref:Uncharacterized protein n=1 Tax=Obba rivulosa TaxID=1052685 RepID=A0A8E2DEB5_9APHY|nr:hypothetical protein OBBRIDRAFT_808081 [Obba rivulosa]